MAEGDRIRVGVVGTGFISRHFALACERQVDLEVSRVLTRRSPESCTEYPGQERLTQALDELLEQSDIVLECSGDPLYATEVVARSVEAGLPVVTSNVEFHVTAGSYFVDKGLVTEAEGDQPGSEAALAEEALAMGFEPLVYGNMKGFLNHHPTPEEMAYWGERQGISLPMVTAFTDGTKLQFEQAIVANGLGATIAQDGLVGLESDDLDEAARQLAQRAEELGQPISDYVLSRKLPHGVFVVAKHDPRQVDALRYLKMGEGPYYVLQRPAVLIHLEIAKTIRRVMETGKPLLNNAATPEISIAAVAKRDLEPGEQLEHGIGSFDLRGIAVRISEHAGHLPIGLVYSGVVKRRIEAGEVLGLDDIELPDSLARTAWLEVERRVLGREDKSAEVVAP